MAWRVVTQVRGLMRLIDYQCPLCKYVKNDVIVSSLDYADPQCPVCQETTMKKMMGSPALKFKGPGFYETDYKNPPREKDE